MLDLLGPFLFGLAGGAHCLGMCGPIIVAYAIHIGPPASSGTSRLVLPAGALLHLAFHAGRLFTYGLLGATAAALAGTGAVSGLRAPISAGAGAIMVLLGAGLAVGPSFHLIPHSGSGGATAAAAKRLSPLFSSGRLASKLALGCAAGFLPCMFSAAMVIKAASTGRPASGLFTMLSFGMGTVPALFVTGLSTSLFTYRVRLAGKRAAALMLAVMGLFLLYKGVAAH